MNNENWLKHYRTNKNAIWIKCKLTNGEELFYPDHTGWLTIKRKCRKHGVFLQDFRLLIFSVLHFGQMAGFFISGRLFFLRAFHRNRQKIMIGIK